MMYQRSVRFISFVIALLGSLYATYAYATLFDPYQSSISSTMATFMKENHVPGAAVIIYASGKPYFYYFGYANPNNTPVTENTIFEIGSLSNMMAGLLFAQEVDMANMKLDDTMRQYIKTLSPRFEDITLKDLATQVSGIGDTASVIPLSRLTLAAEPEKQWINATMNTALLIKAIETATGKDFDKLYHRHILIPLNMQSIGLTIHPKLAAYSATGYDEAGHPLTSSEKNLPAFDTIKASSKNMQKFLSAAIGLPGTPERIFYPMRLTQVAYVQLPNSMQGLGWHIHEMHAFSAITHHLESNTDSVPVQSISDKPTYNGDNLFDQYGYTAGFTSYIAVLPNKQSGVVILTNKTLNNQRVIQVGREILFSIR
ncbi:MAG TPA: serine hydrolase [Gammaproteobacteria bacterium]|nr:serine hydrolase [Gammaproteobacteria bacterium]